MGKEEPQDRLAKEVTNLLVLKVENQSPNKEVLRQDKIPQQQTS